MYPTPPLAPCQCHVFCLTDSAWMCGVSASSLVNGPVSTPAISPSSATITRVTHKATGALCSTGNLTGSSLLALQPQSHVVSTVSVQTLQKLSGLRICAMSCHHTIDPESEPERFLPSATTLCRTRGARGWSHTAPCLRRYRWLRSSAMMRCC